METFGQKFGQLVRDKRIDNDLSQIELAADAGLTAPQVCKLENGNIRRPQAKTVSALCAVLNISQDERANCHPSSDKRLPSKLLETLADQFGIENPEASEETLESFLRAKAIEFREMQERLTALTKTDARISNLLAAAQDALEVGQFDNADDRLADAEEIQQEEHTLAQVRKQAGLRAERAKAALLLGDVEKAFKHFNVAAGFFSSFDHSEQAKHLYDAGLALREYGMRHPGRAVELSVAAYESALKIWTPDEHPKQWGDTMNGLGICFRRLGTRATGNLGRSFLEKAIEAHRAALTVRSRYEYPRLWARTQNNLAAALRHLGTLIGGTDGKNFVAQAIEVYQLTFEVRTRQNLPAGWGESMNNMAIAQRVLGVLTGGADGARRLSESVATCLFALEVRTRQKYPFAWANTQDNLARAQIHLGEILGGDDGVELFRNALTACDSALEVRTREDNPIDWAESKETLALACVRIAQQSSERKSEFVAKATSAIEDALIVADQKYMPNMRDRITILHREVKCVIVDQS